MQSNKQSWKFDKSEKYQIVKSWLNGNSTAKIARSFDVNDETIRSLVKQRIPKHKYKMIAKKHMEKFYERCQIKKITLPPFNEELAWWIGAVKGDGYVDEINYRVCLKVKDKDFAYRWLEIGTELFGIKSKIKNSDGLFKTEFNSKLLVRFIKDNFGLFGRFIWDIPKSIINANQVIKCGFIRGIFDAEGYADKHRGRVGIVSVNKRAIEILKQMLLTIDIESKIRSVNPKNRENTCYILTISNYTNMSIFAKKINFTILRKMFRIQNYLNYMDRIGYNE